MDRTTAGLRTHQAAVRIAQVSRPQYGLFTRRQALEAGFTRHQIEHRLKAGLWVVADSSVYRSASTPVTWHQRLLSACLAGRAVASHRAAGRLWGFPRLDTDLVEVTALRHRRRRPTDVVWHESYHLGERDITTLEGIQLTRPIRTFVDLGSVIELDHLEELLDDGLNRNLLSYEAIGRKLEQLGRLRRGSGNVRRLLDARLGERPSESVLETRFRQLVRRAGLPQPMPQFEVRSREQLIARIDFAYGERMIAVELDGLAYHGGRRARAKDRSRDNVLSALGWRVLRFTWADVNERPDYVVSTIKAALSASA